MACWQWMISWTVGMPCGAVSKQNQGRSSKEKYSSFGYSDRMKTMISLLYMGAIAILLLVSSLLSFFWLPEFQTTSLSCAHHDAFAAATSITAQQPRYSSTFNPLMEAGTRRNASSTDEKYEHLFVQSKNTGVL